MEKSFHQNVFLLTQAVAPSKDFLKYFKEGMFDKPNTVGFLHMSQYLLTIYDAERFKKLLKWPLFCKQDEAKYRTDVRDFIITVAHENPDIDFPQILASHLLHASGSKFFNIMWSLSTVTLRTYLKRETGMSLWAPKPGVAEDLTKMMLNNHIARSEKNIEDIDTRMANSERDAKAFAVEMAASIQKHQDDMFVTRRNLMELAARAPVHPAMKKRLADPNDMEVVEIWKKSIDESLTYLKSKQKRLEEIAEMSNSVAGMVASIASTDSNTLDGERLPKIDTNKLAEIDGLSPETQIILHRLYVNGTMSLENLLILINQVLTDYRRYIQKNGFPNLEGYDSQINASCEDMNSILNLYREIYQRIINLSSEIKNNSTEENRKNSSKSIGFNPLDNDIFDSVLLKSSPTININGNNESERTDVHDRLELTPVENKHKTLFARHQRKDTTPQMSKLRPKLLVSRINFDDTRSSCTSERLMSPVNRAGSSRMMNQSMATRSGKYSHLFSTFQKKKGNRLNSSIVSVPGSWRNSTVADVSPTSDLYNISELRPHLITAEGKFNDNRGEMITPMKSTPTRRNGNPATITNEDKEKTIANFAISKTAIAETTELMIRMGGSPKIRQAEKSSDRNRRTSISDLVERYKRVRENTTDVTAYLENSSDISDESGRN